MGQYLFIYLFKKPFALTLGVCPRTFPARAREPWTLPRKKRGGFLRKNLIVQHYEQKHLILLYYKDNQSSLQMAGMATSDSTYFTHWFWNDFVWLQSSSVIYN